MPEQIRESIFKADHHIAVYFETSEFDKVLQVKNGELNPKMSNLGDNCRRDIRIMKKILGKYQFTKKDNIYSLENSPTF